jgi:hypothetical protein
MDRKAGAAAVAVTREEVRSALARTATLTSEEEKALRMRHGVGFGHAEPLPRAAGRNAELEDELLIIEMQLMRAWRARMAQAKAPSAQAAPVSAQTPRTPQNKSKDKIVRALRKKK